MRIIVNADDFGFDDDCVDATIECIERGIVTSATIMANMPASERAIEFARTRRDVSFGVHLVYGGDGPERPVLPPSEVPALVNEDGAFLQSNTTRMKALLRRIPLEQVERETIAQLEKVIRRDVRLTHVDSHGHLHKFGCIRRALSRALPRFGIRRVRNAQDIFLKPSRRSVTYWIAPLWRRQLMRAFHTTDHFFMPQGTPDETWDASFLEKIDGDTVEVGVHPGRREGWRAAQMRAVELFAEQARARGHSLVGWRDI